MSWKDIRFGVRGRMALTSKPSSSSLQMRPIPPWCGLATFEASTQHPKRDFVYWSSVTFILVRIPIPTPICASPLAAAAIPTSLLQRMFHVAREKGLVPLVPLPPGWGASTQSTSSLSIELVIKWIITKNTNGRIRLVDFDGSWACTKRPGGPPNPYCLCRGEGESRLVGL